MNDETKPSPAPKQKATAESARAVRIFARVKNDDARAVNGFKDIDAKDFAAGESSSSYKAELTQRYKSDIDAGKTEILSTYL